MKQKNGDKIRSKTDIELALFLLEIADSCYSCGANHVGNGKCRCEEKGLTAFCRRETINWLKQERK